MILWKSNPASSLDVNSMALRSVYICLLDFTCTTLILHFSLKISVVAAVSPTVDVYIYILYSYFIYIYIYKISLFEGCELVGYLALGVPEPRDSVWRYRYITAVRVLEYLH